MNEPVGIYPNHSKVGTDTDKFASTPKRHKRILIPQSSVSLKHHYVNSHLDRIWPRREVGRAADMQSLRSESCREKCFWEFPVSEFLSVTHGLSSASEYILTSRTSEPMFWSVQHIPWFVRKSFLRRADGIMLAINGDGGPLYCICLPVMPHSSCVTTASSLTKLYLNHNKIQDGNVMPLLSSCEIKRQVSFSYQRSCTR